MAALEGSPPLRDDLVGWPVVDMSTPALFSRWVYAAKTMNKSSLGAFALYLSGVWTGASAAVYQLPSDGSTLLGADARVTINDQDTLLGIARRYGLGYPEIIRANPGVDIGSPGEGREILLPGRRILPSAPHEGVVINLPEHRLYYYPKLVRGAKPVVFTYPVSIGRMDWRSPLGETRIIGKERHPSWYPPESIRNEHAARGDFLPKVVPPGADNPLGEYKMRLALGDGTYEIHGTNNPVAVGLAVTHGCIRMYPDDVAALFESVSIGTKVRFINEPIKVAYSDGKLVVEVHPPMDDEGQTVEPSLEVMSQKLHQALGPDTAAIHWDFARKALEGATGVPTIVGIQAHLRSSSPSAPSERAL
jgi:L,D-transpeptidase ErfK/SrfK